MRGDGSPSSADGVCFDSVWSLKFFILMMMMNSEDEEDLHTGTEKTSYNNLSRTDPAGEGVDLVGGGADPDPRVILHFDLDCFYAQVEMLRDPALRSKPLGVQQKYIIVTCNYVARDCGVTKLMSVRDALEKCPELVLVKGEDLAPYREASYKVTELLMSYCPLVERLGLDENFVDVTEMVQRRVQNISNDQISFIGHVYGHDATAVSVQDHVTLAVGSMIAAELRGALYSTLGLTSCGGVAHNKLLAKLVSGTFKPNQQSALLPRSVGNLMASLRGPGSVPGIGYRTAQRLEQLGVLSMRDLQLRPLAQLAREFGDANAKRMKDLACGVDPSPVTPSGPPQSLSDEDSFKKISTLSEVQEKIQDLLRNLTERMYKDGRVPQTMRLTLRRSGAGHRWFSRESRQGPVPSRTAQQITHGCLEAVPQLVSIAMKLFSKVVDVSAPFHLTLLNVCFTNLQPRSSTRGSISSFFIPKSPAAGTNSPDASSTFTQSEPNIFQNIREPSSSSSSDSHKRHPKEPKTSSSTLDKQNPPVLPPDIDPDVFRCLPLHIQSELLSSFQSGGAPAEPPAERALHHGGALEEPSAVGKSERAEVPPDVDPVVYSQLPPDVQRELLTEWRRSQATLKVCSKGTKRSRKAPPPHPQSTSLLKYFKPN